MEITAPSALTTALRDIAKGLGGVLVAAGFMTEAQFMFWSGIVIFAVSSGYAIWKQIKMAETATIAIGE